MKKMLVVFMASIFAGCLYAQPASENQPPQNRGGRGSGMMVFGARTPEEIVKKYDKDKDGILSKDELAIWTKDYNLALYDSNGDGVIDEAEQKRADEMKARREEARLQLLDKDGDGVISDEEEKEGMKALRERFRQGGPERGQRRNNDDGAEPQVNR